MPGWIIAAAIGSIVITAGLTWILWRMNRPDPQRDKRGDGSGGDGGGWSDSGRRDHDQSSDSNDSGSDGGGGDGGGGE